MVDKIENIKLVLFDLDGTLVDMTYGSYIAFNSALETLGLQTVSYEGVMSFFKTPYNVILDTVLPKDRDESMNKEFTKLYMGGFSKRHLEFSELIPGTIETIKFLKENDISIALVTRRFRKVASEELEKFKIKEYFDVVVTFEDTGLSKIKPDPTAINMTLDKLGIPAEEALMVGDSPSDIEAGKAAGTKTVLVLTGPLSNEIPTTLTPDVKIQSVADLKSVLNLGK